MSTPKVVADIMIRNPIALQEEENVWEMQEEMQNLVLHHIPVIDGKKLVGIVSQNDLFRHTTNALHRDSVHNAIDARDKKALFVASIMTTEVVTVAPDVSIDQAARLLVGTHFTCLPVVDSERNLLGVLTEKDVLRALLAG